MFSCTAIYAFMIWNEILELLLLDLVLYFQCKILELFEKLLQ